MDKKNFCFKIYPLDKDLKKTWFVSYTVHGRTFKKYGNLAQFNTIEEKQIEAQRIIDSVEQTGPGTQFRRTDLIKSLLELLEYKRPALASKSYGTYFSVIRKFAKWYRPLYAVNRDVNPADFIMQLHAEKYSNGTIRKSLIMLNSFFKTLVKLNHYKVNPFVDVKVKKQKAKSLLPFHPAQIELLKAEILANDPQLWDAVLFEYYLYFRPCEIRQLLVGDILFDEMKIILRDEIAKDDDNYLKAVPVPMQPEIVKYKSYPANFYIFSSNGRPGAKPLSRDALSKRHAIIRKKLNLSPRFAFYSWVHTGIKMAAMAGVPIKQLQIQKGHSDLKMFDEYMKNLGIDDCLQLKNNFPAI